MGVLRANVDGVWEDIAGAKGDPGEAGGSLLSAFWTFNATTSSPPSAGQLRSDGVTATNLWVHETDADGFTRSLGLSTVATGNRVLIRAANGTAADYDVTGTPVDNGTWWTFPVTHVSGAVTKGARTQLNFVLTPAVGLPSGGTTGQVLAKTSGTDYDADWATPGRLAVNAQTGTTYTPVLGDENGLVTLSNAAAINVTLPQDSDLALPVGGSILFTQLGAGQVTFTAGTGATVNSTPTAKTRAQYSTVTAIKRAADTWLIAGDVASS